MTRQTVIAWRARYEAGFEALADLPRSGRPQVIDESTVITQALNRPPANAVVVCVDEKTEIQALDLDRTAPLPPMRFDDAESRTHDYRRHGTTTLFAALEWRPG
jgi:hypothetical protein